MLSGAYDCEAADPDSGGQQTFSRLLGLRLTAHERRINGMRFDGDATDYLSSWPCGSLVRRRRTGHGTVLMNSYFLLSLPQPRCEPAHTIHS